VDALEQPSLEVRRRLDAVEITGEAAEALRFLLLAPAHETLLGMALDREAAREVEPPLEVIFQIFPEIPAVHSQT
jgi:hypothetical protein